MYLFQWKKKIDNQNIFVLLKISHYTRDTHRRSIRHTCFHEEMRRTYEKKTFNLVWRGFHVYHHRNIYIIQNINESFVYTCVRVKTFSSLYTIIIFASSHPINSVYMWLYLALYACACSMRHFKSFFEFSFTQNNKEKFSTFILLNSMCLCHTNTYTHNFSIVYIIKYTTLLTHPCEWNETTSGAHTSLLLTYTPNKKKLIEIHIEGKAKKKILPSPMPNTQRLSNESKTNGFW